MAPLKPVPVPITEPNPHGLLAKLASPLWRAAIEEVESEIEEERHLLSVDDIDMAPNRTHEAVGDEV